MGESAAPKREILFSAPGNILLTGEYLVTRPGGTGIACAVAPRGSAHVRPVDRSESGARNGPSGRVPTRILALTHTRDTFLLRGGSILIDAVSNTVQEHTGTPIPDGFEITVDTSAFFSPDGSKRGFGSSAVATVLLTAALLEISQRGKIGDPDLVFSLAVAAHRRAQSSRGSGYDIAASVYGGWGRFIGGEKPQWIPLTPGRELPNDLGLALSPGIGPVSSSIAVARFGEWITGNPRLFHALLKEGEAIAKLLTVGTDWETFSRGWKLAGELGRRIGRDIGVPAEVPAGTTRPLTKAVGAGDELFVTPVSREETPIELEGLRRERV